MFGSEGLAGLQMDFGMSVKWALDGKHTNRSVEVALLPSLPFMMLLLLLRSLLFFSVMLVYVLAFLQMLCLLNCMSVWGWSCVFGWGF